MKMKKNSKNFSFLLIALVLTSGMTVSAEEMLSKTETFTTRFSSEKDYKNSFQKEIKEKDEIYLLKDVKYQVVETKLLSKLEKKVESDAMKEGDEYSPEPSVTENGVEYKLIDTTKIEKVLIHGESQTVSGYTDYDYVVSVSEVPKTKTVGITNPNTGENINVECKLVSTGANSVKTVTVPMTITFYNYDAKYFEIGGDLVEKNESTPPLRGYEANLLQMAGADPNATITDISWDGGSYDSNGTVCRNAIANVSQDIMVYRALYTEQITIPDVMGVAYQSTYEALDPEGDKEYTVKAIATYEKQIKNMLPIYIGIGIGIVALALLIILLLYFFAKKRKKENTDENTEGYELDRK